MKIPVVHRLKLYQKIDRCFADRQSVFLGACKGWGKTTLAMRWVTHRRAEKTYLAVGDVDFLEKLGAFLDERPNRVLILDDIHLATEREEQQEIRRTVQLADLQLILMSNAELPNYLYDEAVSGRVFTMDKLDLAFSVDDTLALAKELSLDLELRQAKHLTMVTEGLPALILAVVRRIRREDSDSDIERIAMQIGYQLFDQVARDHIPETMQSFYRNVSIAPFIDRGLANELSQDLSGDRSILLSMMNSCILERIGPEQYQMDSLIRKFFLHKLRIEQSVSYRRDLYYTAGAYYERHGRLEYALEMYKRISAHDRIAEILTSDWLNLPGLIDYDMSEPYFYGLPPEVLESSPKLMARMAMLYSISGKIPESEGLYDELSLRAKDESLTENERSEAQHQLWYLDFDLPHRDASRIVELIYDESFQNAGMQFRPYEVNVTNNQPSLLSGYKELLPAELADTAIYTELDPKLLAVGGANVVGLTDTRIGEVLHESANYEHAVDVLAWLNKGLSSVTMRGTKQMQFVTTGVMARVFTSLGKVETALTLLTDFRDTISKSDERYLLPYIDALLMRFYVLADDKERLHSWMQYDAPSSNQPYRYTDVYLHLTKVRVLLSLKEYWEAIIILDRLHNHFGDYQNEYVQAEVAALRAIALYRLDDARWREYIVKALHICQKHQFYRLLSQMGNAVLSMLKECEGDCEPKFYRKLLTLVRKQAKAYPNYMAESKKKDFTETERLVLQYIIAGFDNASIAEAMHIKIRTVKFHCTNIYQKLDVTSRAQAIVAAKQEDPINRKPH